MTAYRDLRPGAQPVAFSKRVTSAATNTLLWRVPWGNPVNKVFEPTKIMFQTATLSGGSLLIWDQDLSSATPASNGSAGGALLTVAAQPYVPATASGASVDVVTIISKDQMPQITFLAGLTCTGPINTQVTVEGSVY